MATVTSIASGLASAGGTWDTGVAPVEGDRVIIAAGHVVTIDGTHVWGDDITATTASDPTTAGGVCAVNVRGTIKASRLVNSSLTVKGSILTNYGTHGIDYGTEADPIPDGVTATLILNKATTPALRYGLVQRSAPSGVGNYYLWTFCGANVRTRGVTLASTVAAAATSLTLSSAAHGWKVDDRIVLMNTNNAATADEVEERIITGVAGAVISWTTGLTYSHAADSPVVNVTNNVVVTSFNEVSNQTSRMIMSFPTSGNATLGYKLIARNATFRNLGGTANNTPYLDSNNATTASATVEVRFDRCAFHQTISGANPSVVGVGFPANVGVRFNNCALYCAVTAQTLCWTHFALTYAADCYHVGGTILASGIAGNEFDNLFACARNVNNSFAASAVKSIYRDSTFCGRATEFSSEGTSLEIGSEFIRCDIGSTFGWTRTVGGNDRFYRLDTGTGGTQSRVTLTDCMVNTLLAIPYLGDSTVAAQGADFSLAYVNKNEDATAQEEYTYAKVMTRSNATRNRSNASVALRPITLGRAAVKTRTIACSAGATVRVIGYIQADSTFYNAGAWTAPTVTLSGLGATPVVATATAAANGAWEKYDISITNSSGADGNFTLTYSATALSVLLGTVYFDGVPDSPYVTACRHYGFTFDATNPARTVDPYFVAAEATAAAYTGATFTTGTKRVTFGAGTIDTFQKLYDYGQAWGVTAITGASYNEMPWTRAGALLSLTTGWTVVDPTITGMTWGGGNIEFNSTGIKDGAFDSCDMTFTAAGTYTFTDATFAGTVELINTSGGAVTVELPSGTSYTNTGPNITVTLPQLYQSVTVTGMVAGSRLQIYDTTSSTELYNAVPGTASYTWTDSVAAAADRAIRVRIANVSGATAYEFIEANIGTCGTTDDTAAVTYLANQSLDTVYNTNAIDGSTVTDITISDGIDRVIINAAGGAKTYPQIYAYQCYWLFTALGIVDDGAFIEASDTANYSFTGFQIRNTSATPLTITGGYGVDSTTGTSAALIDTAGSTGNIFLAPDHVVPFSTGSGLTAGQAADLTATATAVAQLNFTGTAVDANIVKVNDLAVSGAGTEADPWGP